MQDSQILIQRVRHEASRLIEEASDGLTLFRWLDDAGEEGRELYNRVRSLHEAVRDVEVALNRRGDQIRHEDSHHGSEDRNRRQREEDRVLKNTWENLKACHRILISLTRLLAGWGAEVEPTRTQALQLHFRLNILQRGRIRRLHEKLRWRFEALGPNIQAVNQLIQMDTQERIAQTNSRLERLEQANDRIEAMFNRLENAPTQRTPSPQIAPEESCTTEDPAATPESNEGDDAEDSDDDTEHMSDRESFQRSLRQTRIGFLQHMSHDERSSSIALVSTNESPLIDDSSDGNYWKARATNDPRRSHGNIHRSVSFADDPERPEAIAHFPQKTENTYNDLLSEYYHRARANMREKQYLLAENNLLTAIEFAQDRKQVYGTPFNEVEMQDMLGRIFLRSGRFPRALEVWARLLPREGAPAQSVTLQDCKNYFLVGETHYQMWASQNETDDQAMDDLIQAERRANAAYYHLARIMGDNEALECPEARATADLLSRIYDGLGDSGKARVYRRYAQGIQYNADADEEPANARDEAILRSNEKATPELVRAIRGNKTSRALALLKNTDLTFDVDRHFKIREGRHPENKVTMLMIAFDLSSESIVNALIERNADINKKDELHDRSILHRTAVAGNPDMVRLAIKNCKSGMMEAVDSYGLTPLLLAVEENSEHVVEVVQILLDANANITTTNRHGETIVHLAALNASKKAKPSNFSHRAVDLLQYLVLERKDSPNDAKNNIGNTPLMLACENGHPATVDVLLKGDADPNATNNENRSALYLAVDGGLVMPEREQTVRLLLDSDAEINTNELPRKWNNFPPLSQRSVSPSYSDKKSDDSRNNSISRNPPAHHRKSSRTTLDIPTHSRVERTDSTSTMETTNSQASRGSSRLLQRLFSSN
ncbi:ankyrin [Microthyrium microscopicum]|uniref:Ankyrin n=1 Tax=Microthyrium microscopicum TaxID=703497 RepID=A0A6A6TYY7_9PEZI|nr:ankyrin [Microthyrium microscopicum]